MTIAAGIQAAQDTVNGAGMSASDWLNRATSGFKMTPKGTKGIGGFVFDYEDETSLALTAEITDHYAENGSVLADNRVTKPIRVTLRGYVGEVIYQRAAGISGLLGLLQGKLTTVDAYLGRYTPQALTKVQGVLTQAQNTVDKINAYADRAKNLVSMFQKTIPGATKQQKAYSTLFGMWQAGTLFDLERQGIPTRPPQITAETPWTFLESMMIESVMFVQAAGTKYETDITVVLKQVRMASTGASAVDLTQAQGRLQAQVSPLVDKGRTSGLGSNVSVLATIFGGGQ